MAMYYNDHLAAAEKDISSSNFCNLVDASVMLYDEKHRKVLPKKVKSRCHAKKKKKKEEKESDKRFFHLFPKKRRTSVVTVRNPEQNQQNLDRVSTSSSLLDLSTIPDDSSDPRNPLQGLSSSSSSFLGDYKTAADSKRKTPQNPPSSSTLLVEYNTEMTNPPNPKSESNGSGSKSKKAKVAPYSWIGKEAPEWLVKMMGKMQGSEGPRLIYQKTLTETDIKPDQSRLLMPFNNLICNDFLTPVESRILLEEDDTKGVGATLVDPWEVKWGVILKKRKMKKDSGKVTLNYAIICGWNDIVEANVLEEGDDISIWSFRRGRNGILCFALVLPPPPDMA
ncbi:B3 DNA binding domain [Arabidopsis suecica]|uniref:B3 DNA binding domain n=1 Tax=Arabidopsis suecica TaxID=45249 RepID=A0A8T2CF20_ARASU|nr:B3 DNA binding domain [Arabidopsis suecica]